jgi:mannose-6-phosphate isomerase-like protein (cupin superfamily)
MPPASSMVITLTEAWQRLPDPGGRRSQMLSDERLPSDASGRSVSLFDHGSLLVKLYAPRGTDPQTPHTCDEVYVVARGRGLFFDGKVRHPFEPGTFLFAAAGHPHRFEDFSDDFAVWVIYYGPEGGEIPTQV